MAVSTEGEDLGKRMAQLAREFAAPDEVDDVLRRVTHAAVELIPGADCADVLVVGGRRQFESKAATSDLPAYLAAVQIALGEGPCLDAATRDATVRADDLRGETRWPRYACAAVEVGVLSMLTVHLYSHSSTLGALNLYSFRVAGFDRGDEATAEMLGTHAALATAAASAHRQMTSALASRDLIGQAKGMLMERFHIDAIRAFELLRRLSQERNTPLVCIAEELVATGSRLASSRSAGRPAADDPR